MLNDDLGRRMMYDNDIRVALRNRIEKRLHDRPHLLVPEVDVRWGIPVRIDEMLITDKVSGFEIKSDRDSIARLERQIRGCNPFVQRAYLVVGNRLKTHATALLPPWWGIFSATPTEAGVKLKEIRKARSNPEFNPIMLTTYMSRADLTRELRALGETRLSLRTVDDLRFLLLERLGPTKTARAAIAVMRSREDWSVKARKSLETLEAV